MARASAARRQIWRDAPRSGSRLGDHGVVATDAAALQTISGSGLKHMTVPNLPQETCRVRTRKKAHGRAMCRYLRRDAAVRGWARSLGDQSGPDQWNPLTGVRKR